MAKRTSPMCVSLWNPPALPRSSKINPVLRQPNRVLLPSLLPVTRLEHPERTGRRTIRKANKMRISSGLFLERLFLEGRVHLIGIAFSGKGRFAECSTWTDARARNSIPSSGGLFPRSRATSPSRWPSALTGDGRWASPGPQRLLSAGAVDTICKTPNRTRERPWSLSRQAEPWRRTPTRSRRACPPRP